MALYTKSMRDWVACDERSILPSLPSPHDALGATSYQAEEDVPSQGLSGFRFIADVTGGYDGPVLMRNLWYPGP